MFAAQDAGDEESKCKVLCQPLAARASPGACLWGKNRRKEKKSGMMSSGVGLSPSRSIYEAAEVTDVICCICAWPSIQVHTGCCETTALYSKSPGAQMTGGLGSCSISTARPPVHATAYVQRSTVTCVVAVKVVLEAVGHLVLAAAFGEKVAVMKGSHILRARPSRMSATDSESQDTGIFARTTCQRTGEKERTKIGYHSYPGRRARCSAFVTADGPLSCDKVPPSRIAYRGVAPPEGGPADLVGKPGSSGEPRLWAMLEPV